MTIEQLLTSLPKRKDRATLTLASNGDTLWECGYMLITGLWHADYPVGVGGSPKEALENLTSLMKEKA